MSTIEEVRAAEKKVQAVVEALRKTGAQDPDHLYQVLQRTTEEYAAAVRELEITSEPPSVR
jgi:hypothetical protein